MSKPGEIGVKLLPTLERRAIAPEDLSLVEVQEPGRSAQQTRLAAAVWALNEKPFARI